MPEHAISSEARMQTLQSDYRLPSALACSAFPHGTWRSPQICLDSPPPIIGVPPEALPRSVVYRVQCDRTCRARARLLGTCWASRGRRDGLPCSPAPTQQAQAPGSPRAGHPRRLSSSWRGAGAPEAGRVPLTSEDEAALPGPASHRGLVRRRAGCEQGRGSSPPPPAALSAAVSDSGPSLSPPPCTSVASSPKQE